MTDLELNGPMIKPASGGPAKQLVILLHGVGADGNDLIGLAPFLQKGLPDAAFVSPDAPHAFDMAPMGRQWFSLSDLSPSAIIAGVKAAAPVLDRFIDGMRDRLELTDDKVAVLGFSQGTMMALYVTPRRENRLAGVLGFSGMLVEGAALETEAKSKPPIMLIHGEADEVVAHASLELAESGLKAHGFSVKAMSRPGLGHSIDEGGIAAGLAFLRECFSL